MAARDKTPQAYVPALFGGRAIAPVAPVARHLEDNAIPHVDWRVWELLRFPMKKRCESRTDYRVLPARRKTHTDKPASGPAKAAMMNRNARKRVKPENSGNTQRPL